MTEKVLVGGSREPTYQMKTACWRYLAGLTKTNPHLISGGAIGIDAIVEQAAKLFHMKITVCKPDYEKHPPKVAPLKRNEQMAKACDRAAFFWDGQSRGTWHAIQAVRKLGKPLDVFVLEHKVEDPSTLKLLNPHVGRMPRKEVPLL